MALMVMGGGGEGGRGGGRGESPQHFTKEGHEMPRYHTLEQGEQTGLWSNKLTGLSAAKLVFSVFYFFGTTFEEASLRCTVAP